METAETLLPKLFLLLHHLQLTFQVTTLFPVTHHLQFNLPIRVLLRSTWFWDFGDGTTSTLQNPGHTYANPGFYDVSLRITLAGGCTNVITKTQYIKIQPITASILNAPAGGCAPFTFSPIASIQSIDSVISYSWDLGEPGATYNTQYPTHTYNATGSYTLTLTITTRTGCIKTITIPGGVVTGTKPTADFNFTPNNAAQALLFSLQIIHPRRPERLWDGTGILEMAEALHVTKSLHIFFKDTGMLNVQFTVLNNGCPDVVSKTVKVLPPVANFGYKVNCVDHLTVAFSDSSLANVVYGPITYQWDFGDGNTPRRSHPLILILLWEPIHVTLTVTNGPCSYSTSETIVLTNEPADFTISKNPVCKNETFTLNRSYWQPC